MRMWWRRRRTDEDFAAELEAHLALEADRLIGEGLNVEDAEAAARRAFGNVTAVRERFYESSRLPVFDQVRQDGQYAIRTFKRTPGFTVAAILTLGLGVGATVAVYSLVNTLLLRPLPYPRADRLVRIIEHVPAAESPSGAPVNTSSMNQDAFLWWRDQSKTLAHLAATLTAAMTVRVGGETRRINGARVSASLFSMLAVRPLAGRVFVPDDEHANVAILAESAWRQIYASDSRIVGRSIVIDGVPFTVIGVMPPGFDFPLAQTQIWIPYVVEGNDPNRIITVDVLGELLNGVSVAAASAEANVIGSGFIGLPPPGAPDAPITPRFEVIGLQDHLVEPFRPALRVLMTSVGVVLLIVCANVANLLMARGAARQRELEIRRALGAGRGRIMRQVLTESLVLSIAGSVAGIGLAYAGLRLVTRLTAIDVPAMYGGQSALLPGIERVGIDTGVLIFALAVCFVTSLVSGLIPALQFSRVTAVSRRRGDGEPSRLARMGRRAPMALTLAQLALAMMLLVSAGLLIGSFVRLSRVDLGYTPTRALTFELVLPPGVSSVRRLGLVTELTARLSALPGVEAAGFTGAAPLSTLQGGWVLTPPGMSPSEVLGQRGIRNQRANVTSPGYLRAIGARLVEGRWLDAGDGAVQPPPMLVNRELARRFFGGRSPLGRSVDIGGLHFQVVGVVDDVRSQALDLEPDPQAYVDPARMTEAGRAAGWQRFGFDGATPEYPSFAVRVTGNPTRLVPEVRGLVSRLDPLAAVDGAVAMQEIIAGALTRPRFYAVLLGILAGIAAVLAAVGVYGILAYAVTLRTHEIGVRMALGARRRQVMGMVLREGSVVTAVGLALGVAGALAFTRYLRGMLFGLSPLDPATFIVVTITFAGVAMLASYVPARRATNVDPLAALRAE